MCELPAIVSKQRSQAVGFPTEETESTMKDTLETVPVEQRKRKRNSSIDSLLVAYTLKLQRQSEKLRHVMGEAQRLWL